MNPIKDFKVAFLLPSTWFYWQPVLAKLAIKFPQTKLFTTHWTGFSKGLDQAFLVQELSQRKFVEIKSSKEGYSYGFTYLPLGIVNKLLEFKPNFIFSNSFGIWTILAILAKPLGRWKIIIAYEGSSPNVDYAKSPLRLGIRKVMAKFSDGLVTNSQAGERYLVEVLKISPDKVYKKPYEVPVAEAFLDKQLDSTDLPIEPGKKIFLYVGKIVPRKGIHYLLNACVALKKSDIEDFALVIIGNGNQKNELEEFCNKNGLNSHVFWLGRIDYQQLGAYFKKADVFVLPTLEDTWGMVVLEAMLFSKPILCSKWAGSSDLVEHGKNGYVFDPRDTNELSRYMASFIKDGEKVIRMGHESGETIKQFTPAQAADNFVEIIVNTMD
ncbi:glycosyltransferase family 4 protein [Leptolyngbya subtilissima ST-M1]|uniref:glycosyltransferase family 4 protein n=1 Tax=Cyanophyceae TaxID=3028117 RepID=UPI0018EFEC51|nr:glycosyltransferase family 4 protein [Nodosilinea sp. FACHB-131]